MKDIMSGNQDGGTGAPIGKGIMLLQTLTRQIPGFIPAYMMIAKAKLAVGDDDGASSAISQALNFDPKN